MQIEVAKTSLPGNRSENQDRVDVFRCDSAALLVAVDGMGGHTEGAKAAEITVQTLRDCFSAEPRPLLDPQGFLTLSLAYAHTKVVELGAGVAMDHRPRATCAVCLVQDASAYWAHVGDSRIYLLQPGGVLQRTRDHSHVELLLREGLIGEAEARFHPMRNFVECCLGGDVPLPNMSISARRRIRSRDVLLVCTDGLWSGVEDVEIGSLRDNPDLAAALAGIAEQAVATNRPHSDNTSAAALRWIG